MPALTRQLRSHAELKQIMVTMNYFFLGWMRWKPSSSRGAKKNLLFHSFTLQAWFNQWGRKLLTFYHSSYCMQWRLLRHLLPHKLYYNKPTTWPDKRKYTTITLHRGGGILKTDWKREKVTRILLDIRKNVIVLTVICLSNSKL